MQKEEQKSVDYDGGHDEEEAPRSTEVYVGAEAPTGVSAIGGDDGIIESEDGSVGSGATVNISSYTEASDGLGLTFMPQSEAAILCAQEAGVGYSVTPMDGASVGPEAVATGTRDGLMDLWRQGLE